jgi:CarboxypepD_reg-like domain
VITLRPSGISFIKGLLLVVLFIPEFIYSQTLNGRVFSRETDLPVGYVNVGIVGRNIGTVTDLYGNYSLNIDPVNHNDSIRFSMIGYQSKIFLISQFIADSVKNVYLDTRTYTISEVKVVYHKLKIIVLGNPVTSDKLKSGFDSNTLGAELGIKLGVRRQVVLTDLNLNVAICSFDSVTYRLNIYQIENKTGYRNILTTPIYISFTKDKINDVITFDLRKYSIIVQGDVLISLELYKDLGEGKLLFNTTWFSGTTYHRQTSQGRWIEAAGVIGIYLNGRIIK